MRIDRTSRGCRPIGFSLVEILVVVGIIAVVAALILAAVSKARGSAQRVACMSNLRQIGQAFVAYATDHNGSFPAPAGVQFPCAEDWVHWQPGWDLKQSRLLRYLKNDARVLKCASAPAERTTTPPYPYSYSVNNWITGSGVGTYGKGWAQFPCKFGQVVEPSMKILAIEEEVTAINDGEWWADNQERGINRHSTLSVYHDKGREYGGGPLADPQYNERGRGNVVFADGQTDFVHRSRLLRQGWIDPTTMAGRTELSCERCVVDVL